MNNDRFGRTILGLAAGGFVLLLVLGVLASWLVTRQRNFAEFVARARAVEAQVGSVVNLVQGAESAQRGYLIAGDEAYLAPLREAVNGLPPELDALRRLTDADADRAPRVLAVEQASRAKLAELTATVELARSGRREEAVGILREGEGLRLMREIRDRGRELQEEERRSYEKRAREGETAGFWVLLANLAGLALLAATAAAFYALVRRYAGDLLASEATVRSQNLGLMGDVQERTASLLRANAEIQRFAYIVSHDLRAPLVNVMGFTTELEAARVTVQRNLPRNAPEDVRLAVEEDMPEAIGFIRTSTAKMDRLIDAILRLSREGRRNLTPEAVDVGALVKDCVGSLRHQLDARGAEVVVQPGLPPLVTDRFAAEQVFGNLLDNAVKYLDASREGRIQVRGSAPGDGTVVYEVQDNGRGIDGKDHERIFELFRRAGAQDRPGEGLGLAFVRAVVRRLGGEITVDSSPGLGATFKIVLPERLAVRAEAH